MSEDNKLKNPFRNVKYNAGEQCKKDFTEMGRNIDDGNINNDMTVSYSEISLHSSFPLADLSTQNDIKKNSALGEVENTSSSKESINEISDEAQADEDGPRRPASLVYDKSFPYNLEGTVSKDGDMTHFVAENLEYKIKLSSPVTKKDNSQAGSSRNSTPSASGLIPRQFLLVQQSPQIDSNVLNDIELEAQYLAASVDNLTENLCNLLHSISSITADNVEIHKNAVNKLTDNMDANIKSMYTIMAKTEEISKAMKPTEQLAIRIREIKRLVDMLEGTL